MDGARRIGKLSAGDAKNVSLFSRENIESCRIDFWSAGEINSSDGRLIYSRLAFVGLKT